MIVNLALGSALMALTGLTHTVGLILLSSAMVSVISLLRLDRHDFAKTISILPIVVGLFALHGVEILLWAGVMVWIGALPDVNTALYFSATSFSTLGYGDVVMPATWRVFGSLEGLNGFLLIGWSTAYLVSACTRHGPFRSGTHF